MDMFSIFILIVLIIGSCVFLPQVYQIIKTKDTKGLSATTYIAYTIALLTWSIYSSFIGNITNYAINRANFLISIPLYYYLFKNMGKMKYFNYYISINSLFTLLSIAMITTRLLGVWGPGVDSSNLHSPRPIWFEVISWTLSMIGAVIMGSSFLPQVIHSVKQKAVKINIWTMIILCTTQSTWCLFWVSSLLTTHPSLGEWLPGLLSASFTASLQMVLIISWFVFREYKTI